MKIPSYTMNCHYFALGVHSFGEQRKARARRWDIVLLLLAKLV